MKFQNRFAIAKTLGLFYFSFLIAINVFSQDTAYYTPAFNSSGNVLKLKLHQLIKNHTQFPYTAGSTDVWDILKATDRDTVNPDNVILIYSGRSVDAAQEYNGGAGWTREHVWAKSRGDFGTDPGAGTDVHHLRPCDKGVNSSRNNRNFDDCITCVDVVDNGFNTGSKRDASKWTFEPRDDVKGDVARMIFYMAVRYEGNESDPDLELVNTILSKSDKSPKQAVLTTLLEWNKQDPVSAWEHNRNNIIYNNYQHNRNPFIDFPELAQYLWGDSLGMAWMSDALSVSSHLANAQISVYPNPTNGTVQIKGNYKTVQVYNLQGQLLTTNIANNTVIGFENLPKGVYFFRITNANNELTVFRIIKN